MLALRATLQNMQVRWNAVAFRNTGNRNARPRNTMHRIGVRCSRYVVIFGRGKMVGRGKWSDASPAAAVSSTTLTGRHHRCDFGVSCKPSQVHRTFERPPAPQPAARHTGGARSELWIRRASVDGPAIVSHCSSEFDGAQNILSRFSRKLLVSNSKKGVFYANS